MKKSLGLIEGRGLAGIIKATDQMPKISEVEIFKYTNIGGGFNNIVFSGEVGAIKAAVDLTAEYVEDVGMLHTTDVIPSPHEDIYEFIQNPFEKIFNKDSVGVSLGLVETKGFVPMIRAADSGIKSSDIILSNWLTIGGGYTTVFFRGDVAAVKSAVEFAVDSASKVGEIVSEYIIPSPHVLTNKILPVGKIENFSYENNLVKNNGIGEALGVIETQGFAPIVAAVDAGLKSASVISNGWYKVGSAMVSTVFRGDVAAVKAAIDSAKNAASKLGKVLSAYVIPKPDKSVENIFES
jgi:carbon dioxide concentrating mechanism protein CcmO